MKRTHLFLFAGLAMAFIAGYVFVLARRGTEKMAPSMIERAAIAPLGGGVSGVQKIQ